MKYSISHSRLPHRFSWLVVFGALVLTTVAVPVRLEALPAQSEPAAQPEVTEPSASAANAPKTEPAKSEKEENDQYRHSAMVQALARLMHLDIETAARLFEFINVAVVVLAIAIPLFRLLPKLLRNRSEKVRSDLESARKVTEDANTRLSAVEAKLASLGDEIAKVRSDVEQEILQDEARIKAALEEERARIVASAEQEIALAAAQAKRGLRHFAADLAIDQAARQLVLTPETDRALIAEFIRDASTNGAGKGGQN